MSICWYFKIDDLKQTPSICDGIDEQKEARYRREGANLIMECGTNLGLRYDTMATGVVFFHRFYMFHSFNKFPRYLMATCCLFLAGKVEETPKKCKDIVKTSKSWLESKGLGNHISSFGEDPIKEIMIHERILLQTIKFDLQVDHPYGYLVKYAKSLKGDTNIIKSIVQMAWTFINDSLSTNLCLQWEPEIIAIAFMYLASKLSQLKLDECIDDKENNCVNWWDKFVEGLKVEVLEDICHQILDLYALRKEELEKLECQSTTNQQQHVNTYQEPQQLLQQQHQKLHHHHRSHHNHHNHHHYHNQSHNNYHQNHYEQSNVQKMDYQLLPKSSLASQSLSSYRTHS